MKDALTTNTLGRKGQGNQGGFRLVGRVCSRREAGEEKRQTEGITCQVAGSSTIFHHFGESIAGQGFEIQRVHVGGSLCNFDFVLNRKIPTGRTYTQSMNIRDEEMESV